MPEIPPPAMDTAYVVDQGETSDDEDFDERGPMTQEEISQALQALFRAPPRTRHIINLDEQGETSDEEDSDEQGETTEEEETSQAIQALFRAPPRPGHVVPRRRRSRRGNHALPQARRVTRLQLRRQGPSNTRLLRRLCHSNGSGITRTQFRRIFRRCSVCQRYVFADRCSAHRCNVRISETRVTVW